MRLKRLDVPCYIKYIYNCEKDYLDKELEEMKYKKIYSILGIDGWYYDRIAKFSWIEYKSLAVTGDELIENFIYAINYLNRKTCTANVIAALNTLKDYRVPIPAVKELLREHEEELMIRNLTRISAAFTQVFGKKNEQNHT